MKIRNIFLTVLFAVGFFMTADVQKVSAVSCTGTGQSTCATGNICSNSVCVASPSTTTSATKFTNPLEFSTVEGFLGGIMSAIQKIIVVLALVSITIGSVFILASAGNSGMVEKGKGAITMALVGLAIGIAAPSLLKELASIIGWGDAVQAKLTLSQIAVNVLNFLLGTMGILALIMLVIGAIMYLTSAGDEDRIDKGKEIFKYSLIGVLLAMASMVLVTQIARFFAPPQGSPTTINTIDRSGLTARTLA